MLKLRWATRGCLLAVLLMGAGAPSSSAAYEKGDTLRLADVLGMVAEQSPAVRASLARAEAARGQQMSAAGYVDPAITIESVSSRFGSITLPSAEASGWGRSFRLGIVQRTGWGVSVHPYVGREAAVGFSAAATTYGLDVSVPLLRFGRRSAERSILMSARATADAAVLGHRHILGAQLFAATVAYWDLQDAQVRLSILEDAAHRASEVSGIVGRLADAGERAEADRNQADAFVADRKTELAQAHRVVWDAATNLALLTQATPATFVGAYLIPEESSSGLPAGDHLSGLPEVPLLDKRPDVRAAQRLLDAEEIVTRSMALDLLPRLNLDASVGRVFGGEVASGYVPTQVSVGVSLGTTLMNRFGRGRLQSQRARRREAAAALEEVRLEARAGWLHAQAAARYAKEGVETAVTAEAAHRITVENERRKLESGFATVLDVILAEDRLTGARLSLSAARSRLRKAVARVVFESGGLVLSLNESADTWEARLIKGGSR